MAEVKKEEGDLERVLDESMETSPGPALSKMPASHEPPDPEAKIEASVKAEVVCASRVAVPGTMPLHPDGFKDNALALLSAELKHWHGPAQYLRQRYQTNEQLAEFASALQTHFPPRDELIYHGSKSLPMGMNLIFPLRLCDLGFDAAKSTKPAPFLHTCLELLDEYLTNNVCTEKDPLLLFQGPTPTGDPDECPSFWTHYVKGSARACAMLFLASQVIERGWSLDSLSPDLQRSLTAIFARRELMSSDSQSVALANAKLSQQGSIRKAHCVLTWLGKLALLQQKGLNPEQVIKAWNQGSTQAGSLQGNKRVALLQLLNMPSAVTQVLLEHLSEFGSNTAFLEDAFSNKKLSVGARSRSGSKVWNDRLQVTEQGLLMMVQFVHRQHQKKLPGTHQKMRKEGLEEALAMSQVLISLAAELVDQNPISQSIIETEAHLNFFPL